MDKDLMIDLKDIVIHRDERKILSISTQIPRQGITAVIGPNGSGNNNPAKTFTWRNRGRFRYLSTWLGRASISFGTSSHTPYQGQR